MSLNKFKELGEPIPKEKIILPLKHELFAQELIKQSGNQTKAYSKVYDKSPKEISTAMTNSSVLLSKQKIRARVVQIMNEKGLTLNDCVSSLKTCVQSENEGIKLEATKTAFKLHDSFPSEKDGQEAGDTSMQIVFAKVIVNRPSKEQTVSNTDNSQHLANTNDTK